MSDKIERYYHHRVKNIFNQIHDFEIIISESSLHDFRIEIKKLKALTKFLKFIYGKKEIKRVKNLLDTIFQEAGNIRELQILQSWLEENNFIEIEKVYLQEHSIAGALTTFHNKLPEFKKQLNSLLKPNHKLLEKTNQLVVDQYVLKLKYSIEKKLQKKQSESEWHPLRKLIKQWTYASNWISPEDDASDIKFLYAYCNKLQIAIGNWHDKIIIQEALLDMQLLLPKELSIQKEFVIALKKINSSIELTHKEVKLILNKFKLPKKEKQF